MGPIEALDVKGFLAVSPGIDYGYLHPTGGMFEMGEGSGSR